MNVSHIHQLWGLESNNISNNIPSFENAQYFFEVFDLVDAWELFITIPFDLHTQKEMQFPKVLHFKLMIQLLFDLQKFILIIAHQNEVIHIDHNEELHISHFCNTHIKIGLTFYKFNAFEKLI